MCNRVLLVGGELCQRVALGLDEKHWRVHGLRRNPPGKSGIQWIRADLGQPGSLRDLPRGITHVL
jgi:uncharacterized protein YbjT (DUF2867 family)